ncbi:hypothetical protein GCM10018787_52740 [Streptomyces thermodiastaticus]|nr:hypothetical protein GCM10018787_52740 [Streptomyces thermodiastaticus]
MVSGIGKIAVRSLVRVFRVRDAGLPGCAPHLHVCRVLRPGGPRTARKQALGRPCLLSLSRCQPVPSSDSDRRSKAWSVD